MSKAQAFFHTQFEVQARKLVLLNWYAELLFRSGFDQKARSQLERIQSRMRLSVGVDPMADFIIILRDEKEIPHERFQAYSKQRQNASTPSHSLSPKE